MLLRSGAHLTYCTNIHAGERWDEVRANLERHVLAVKRRVCPDRPFGVGLRLSAQAAAALATPEAVAELRAWLEGEGLYVFTLNGFPYGRFHGTEVKERVYLPDWRDPERVRYTNALADILAALLPDGMEGSISTVPGAFRSEVRALADVAAIVEHVLDAVAHLHALRERTGRSIALALEPEPACLLETTAEAVAFFERELYSGPAVARLSARAALGRDEATAALRRHLGVCLDTCHAAVEHEDPDDTIALLRAARIPIAKLQLSAGLRVSQADAGARAALAPYLDRVYLHQVVERRGNALVRHVDLPDALAAAEDPTRAAGEWRVHFHVPIFRKRLSAFASTQPFLARVLALQRAAPVSTHLEVETYTWDVLPPDARTADVDEAVAREIEWVLGELGER